MLTINPYPGLIVLFSFFFSSISHCVLRFILLLPDPGLLHQLLLSIDAVAPFRSPVPIRCSSVIAVAFFQCLAYVRLDTYSAAMARSTRSSAGILLSGLKDEFPNARPDLCALKRTLGLRFLKRLSRPIP